MKKLRAAVVTSVVLLVLFGCKIPDADTGTIRGTGGDASYFVGTAAFPDQSAVLGISLDSQSARAVATTGVFGYLKYGGDTYPIEGTYDPDDGSITATVDATAAGIVFSIVGEVKAGVFEGTITRTAGGVTTDSGTVSLVPTDALAGGVTVFEGTYGTEAEPALWGTFNFARWNGAVYGTWASNDGSSYSGFLRPLPAPVPSLAALNEPAAGAFGIYEGDQYIGWASATEEVNGEVKGVFYDTYEPDGDGHWEGEEAVTFDFDLDPSERINDVAVAGSVVYAVGSIQNPLRKPSGRLDWTIHAYDSTGNQIWQDQQGKKNGELNSVAVAPDGSVWVAGWYEFDGKQKDWLVRKYAPGETTTDQTIKPEKQKVGKTSGMDIAYGVAVDNEGNAFVVGALKIDAANGVDDRWAVYSFAPDGTLRWKCIQGSRAGGLRGVAVDPNDQSIWVVGYYAKSETNPETNWLIRTFNNSYTSDPHEAELPKPPVYGDAQGYDVAYDVDIDAAGNIFVVGVIADDADPDTTDLDWTTRRYNPDGSVEWTSRMGDEKGVLKGVDVAPDGLVYVSGYYEFTDKQGSFGGKDWLVRRFENDYASEKPDQSWVPGPYGGPGEDVANGIAVGPGGTIWVGGYGASVVGSFVDPQLDDARLSRYTLPSASQDISEVDVF
jgi:hypothetical protein